MQDNDQTPDQVAAGAYPTPEQRDQGGLVDALRSRGTLPSGLADMMAPPIGPNPGLAAGSAVLNTLAGINHWGNVQHSQNPYMDDMYRQSALQARINEGQMAAAQHQMQLQEQMRMNRVKENDAAGTILQGLLFGPNRVENAEARGPLARQFSQFVGMKTGTPIPQAQIDTWSKGGPAEASNKTIAMKLAGASVEKDPMVRMSLEDDAKTFYMQHGGDPKEWGIVRANLTNPIFLKAMNIESGQDLAVKQLDYESKLRKGWIESHPVWGDQKDDKGHVILSGLVGIGDDWVRRNFRKSLLDLRDDNPGDKALMESALDYAKAVAKTNIKDRLQQEQDQQIYLEKKKSDIIEQREKNVAGFKNDIKPVQQKPLNQNEIDKALQPLRAAEDGNGSLAMLNGALQRMEKKGLLAKDTGMYEAYKAKGAQLWNYNDSDVLNFKQNILPLIIGQIDRGMMDEKNVRFKAAFDEQVRLAQSTPTVEAFRRLSDMYQYMLATRAARRVYELERLRGDQPELVSTARDMFETMYPNGIPGDPSLLPVDRNGKVAGKYIYRNKQPVIVSPDGSEEWNGREWIPSGGKR